MPRSGYTHFFENMLANEKISIMLNTDYRDIWGSVKYRKMIYTGPVDAFYDFRFGKLYADVEAFRVPLGICGHEQ